MRIISKLNAKTFYSILTWSVTCCMATSAMAQEHRRAVVDKQERLARAEWQPVRTVQNEEPMVEEPAARELVPEEVPARLERGQQWSETEPWQQAAPMPGGEVMLEPFYGGGMEDYGPMACDAMGCDSPGCGVRGCNDCRGGAAYGWRPCVTLCFPQSGWVSFEYLLWYQDGMDLPPLVTRSPNDIAEVDAGVRGTRGLEVLFGDDEYLTDSLNGGRLRVGLWLDACQTWAVEGEFFSTATEEVSFSQTSGGQPVLGRPFYDLVNGQERAELIAFPGRIAGTVSVHADTQLQGGGVSFRRLFAQGDGCGDTFFANVPAAYTHRLDGLIGYRFVELDDSVTIHEDLTTLDTPGNFDVTDRFESRSQFNGVDFGASYRRARGCWTLDLLAKLAIGTTRQTVNISGSTTRDQPAVETANGGILALPGANIGRYKRDRFSVVPELGATLGYQLTDHLRATVGYTFIYWSNVVRAGDQIDLDINPNLIPFSGQTGGPARPDFTFVDSDYWVQGISFGGEYRW